MSPEDYIHNLESVQSQIHELGMRLFPTSFDPTTQDMPFFLRNTQWRWQTLTKHLKSCRATGVLVRLSLFWQVEPLVFYACQEASCFPFLNDAANMPVGRMAVQHAHIDTVLTTADDAARFITHLNEHNAPVPPNWIIIHDMSDVYSEIPLDAPYVAHEAHVFPGIPLLTQTPELAQNKTVQFGLADGYTCQIGNDSVLISGTEHDAVPLQDYTLPKTLTLIDGLYTL